MSNSILLDYFFPITSITPTPDAATGFLKQACLVVKPNGGGVAGQITECVSNAEVAVVTNNVEAAQLFAAGMSKVFILQVDELDEVGAALDGYGNEFFTVLISSDFADEEVEVNAASGTITVTNYANLVSGTDDSVTIEGVTFTAQEGAVTLGQTTFRAATSNEATATSLAAQINAHATIGALVTASVVGAVVTVTAKVAGAAGNTIGLSYTDNDTNVGITLAGLDGGNLSGGSGLLIGSFKGVVGISSDDPAFLEDVAATEKRVGFYTSGSNGAKNMCYAFGKMLSNALNWRNQQYISMPFADDVDTNGEANSFFDDKVSFVLSDNEFGDRLGLFAVGGKAIVAPYIVRNLELDLQSKALSYVSGNQPQYTKKEAALIEDELQKVIQLYIDRQWIEAGTVEVKLEQSNFVASGYINIAEPKALWRIFGEMKQTL